ncbi:uncharacterized protein BJX67DRAFT_386508 [Aspergillus lucknowensis]|uniref:Uncharacterized protein n=1 Tax=Aspergillus lucknowensis TaxID=176173 RepID=A0ABR4L5U7_9EURO
MAPHIWDNDEPQHWQPLPSLPIPYDAYTTYYGLPRPTFYREPPQWQMIQPDACQSPHSCSGDSDSSTEHLQPEEPVRARAASEPPESVDAVQVEKVPEEAVSDEKASDEDVSEEPTPPSTFIQLASGPCYHEYRFGERDMNWIDWLETDEPASMSLDDCESDGEGRNQDEECRRCDCEWKSPEPEEYQRGSSESESESADGRVPYFPTMRIPVANRLLDPNDTDEELGDSFIPNAIGTPLTQSHIVALKAYTLGFYSPSRFMKLPQVIECISRLGEDEILSILEEKLQLSSVKGTKCTRLILQHPDSGKLRIIRRAFPQKMDDDDREIVEYNLMAAARELSISELRELLRSTLETMETQEIYQTIFAPRVTNHELMLVELYGSAAAMGEVNGFEFGLHSQQWWDCMSGGLKDEY